MDKQTVITALAALAHPIRLDAFRLLVRAGREGLTPGRMVETLEVPYAKLGFHLKELTIAGLVSQEPAGRHVIYRAAYERMDEVLSYLTEHCCTGVPAPAAAGDAAGDAADCRC